MQAMAEQNRVPTAQDQIEIITAGRKPKIEKVVEEPQLKSFRLKPGSRVVVKNEFGQTAQFKAIAVRSNGKITLKLLGLVKKKN